MCSCFPFQNRIWSAETDGFWTICPTHGLNEGLLRVNGDTHCNQLIAGHVSFGCFDRKAKEEYLGMLLVRQILRYLGENQNTK